MIPKIAALLNLLFRPAEQRLRSPRPTIPRLHLPASTRRHLARQTRHRRDRSEPLALLRVRFASETQRSVIVAVGVIPFPNEAYAASNAGAAFSTRWLMEVANHELRSNAGLMLVHSHGGLGRPQFSAVDARTNCEVMGRLSIGVDAPYGAMALSSDDEAAVTAVDGHTRDANVVIVPDFNLKEWKV